MRPAVLICVLALVLPGASSLGAQTVWLQVGVTKPGAAAEPEVGVRLAAPVVGAVGVEASIDLHPRYLIAGALAGVGDLSLVGEVRPVRPVAIYARVGGTGLTRLDRSGAVLRSGCQGGVGLAVTADARTTVRLDYTYRRVRASEGFRVLPSLTFGFRVLR